jgi:hypothetical protein
MGIFHRESTWDRVRDAAVDAATEVDPKQLAKVAVGVVGTALTATAASAVVSSLRARDAS